MTEKDKIFLKACSMCHQEWESVKKLVEEQTLELNGYQVSFKNPGDGFIVLTHNTDSCGSTIMVKVRLLEDLYNGPHYEEALTGTSVCDGHCLNRQDLEPCHNECALAWIRIVLQYFKEHKLPE